MLWSQQDGRCHNNKNCRITSRQHYVNMSNPFTKQHQQWWTPATLSQIVLHIWRISRQSLHCVIAHQCTPFVILHLLNWWVLWGKVWQCNSLNADFESVCRQAFLCTITMKRVVVLGWVKKNKQLDIKGPWDGACEIRGRRKQSRHNARGPLLVLAHFMFAMPKFNVQFTKSPPSELVTGVLCELETLTHPASKPWIYKPTSNTQHTRTQTN